MAKNVLDKKALAAGIATPALQFLQGEKRKHVHIIDLTSCWHSCSRVIIFMSGKAKICIYNRPN